MQTVKVGSKGKDATTANYILMGHNIFRKQTLESAQGGSFTKISGQAAKDMKWFLGYPKSQLEPIFGKELYDYLQGHKKLTPAMHLRRVKRKFEKPQPPNQKYVSPVKNVKFKKIGFPGQGTHSWVAPPNNWESDNAVDMGIPEGTALVAVADGKIGPNFGPLVGAGEGRFAGIRLHLITADDEFYYAHLKTTEPGIGPGVKVRQGQLLGHSGVANGVPHLHLGEKNGNPATNFF